MLAITHVVVVLYATHVVMFKTTPVMLNEIGRLRQRPRSPGARFTKYLTIYHKIIVSLSYDRLTIVT